VAGLRFSISPTHPQPVYIFYVLWTCDPWEESSAVAWGDCRSPTTVQSSKISRRGV